MPSAVRVMPSSGEGSAGGYTRRYSCPVFVRVSVTTASCASASPYRASSTTLQVPSVTLIPSADACVIGTDVMPESSDVGRGSALAPAAHSPRAASWSAIAASAGVSAQSPLMSPLIAGTNPASAIACLTYGFCMNSRHTIPLR